MKQPVDLDVVWIPERRKDLTVEEERNRHQMMIMSVFYRLSWQQLNMLNHMTLLMVIHDDDKVEAVMQANLRTGEHSYVSSMDVAPRKTVRRRRKNPARLRLVASRIVPQIGAES